MRANVEMGTVIVESWHEFTAAMRNEKVDKDRGGIQKGFEVVCMIGESISSPLGEQRHMEGELEESAEHLQVLAIRSATDRRRCTDNCPTAMRPYTSLGLFVCLNSVLFT